MQNAFKITTFILHYNDVNNVSLGKQVNNFIIRLNAKYFKHEAIFQKFY